MATYHEKYQVIEITTKLKNDAEKWLADNELFIWQNIMMEVSIKLYNQNLK